MRYIVVSDVHSCFDKLIEELNKVHFDPKKDCLISDGDLFDRGDKPLECLEYIMALPHKILLYGNHELELMRLISTGWPEQHDFHNMTTDTLLKLAGQTDENFYSYKRAATTLKDMKNPVSKLLNKYLESCHYAAVFDKYIVTHSWLPCIDGPDYEDIVDPEWDLATKEEWHEACWANPINRCNANAYVEGKTLVAGHRHAWRIAENYGESRIADDEETLDASPYAIGGLVRFTEDGWVATTDAKAVFIDGCAIYDHGGKVNAFVIHSSKRPKLVDARPEYNYEILDD